MKKTTILYIVVSVIFVILVVMVVNLPKGAFSYKHCGDASPNSQVCFCNANEEKIMQNDTYICKEAEK